MKPRRRRQLRTTGKGARRSPHQIDSFVERVQPGRTGRSAPFSSAARGILGLNCWAREDLFKRCLPKIIRSFAFEVLNDFSDLGSVPEDVAAVVGGHAGGPLRSRAPSPGAAMTSDRHGRGNRLGTLLGTTPWPTLSCFPGRDPGPLPSGPLACPGGPAQPQPEAPGRAAGNRMRLHDVSGALWPYPPRRLTLP